MRDIIEESSTNCVKENAIVEEVSTDKPDRPWLFKKGRSGNPAGRPSESKNVATLQREMGIETLDELEKLSKKELIRLITRVSGAMWGIGLLDDDAAFEAMRLKLLTTGLTSDSQTQSLSHLKEWADRTKGRAVQSVSMKVEINPLEKMSTARLLALEQEISARTGIMIDVTPPMPEKLG